MPGQSAHIVNSLPPPSTNTANTRSSPANGLTTFPNPFEDEPEPGILPAFLSKVKNTFVSSTSNATSSTSTVRDPPNVDKGPATPDQSQDAQRQSSVTTSSQTGGPQVQTEAQAIAEAARSRNNARRQSTGFTIHEGPGEGANADGRERPTIEIPTTSDTGSSRRSTPSLTPIGGSKGVQKPPLLTLNSDNSSISRISNTSALPTGGGRRLLPPGERLWKPSGVAPAQVTISPVTSVTTTVQSASHGSPAEELVSRPVPPNSRMTPQRAHFGLQNAVSQRAINPLGHTHAHGHTSGGIHSSSPGGRLRRSSIATLHESPSSVSLSAMIAANAELSQNVSYVPGFPLGQDDTRSVRSLGFVKKSNSVSRLIRRMRGEGLSKHYWMADEHCKECYDCKSAFTAWRRKHHCRICGQIFCSRCASNIIGARRFGQEGAVRVCNLCLKIMEEYKDDHDDDDRKSINSIATSARLPSITDRAFLDAAVSPELSYAKSPFAASQLFTSNPNESLAAIDESSVPTRWRDHDEMDRPYTPNGGGSQSDDEDIWTMRPNTAAPFRRPVDDENKESGVPDSSDQSPDPAGSQSPSPPSPEERHVRLDSTPHEMLPRRVEFPRSDTYSSDGGENQRAPLHRVDSNAPLIGLRTRLSSRASQGGLTALIDGDKAEGLWRVRSHSFAHRPETLSGPSLSHFHRILEQAIERAGLPNPTEWHRVLSRLLLKASSSVQSNVRAGDSIDVRTYVKIKKVPGGKISDSEYVDGIVITKNVAHKAMPRRLVNPRIMVVTFPLDYHRVENQFMSLDPILAQEKDYLRLLTRRIIDVRPHIVLVERTASRIALDYLLEANIAVARSVKLSAIHQVARCTQADVVASMDRLALEPRLGRCAEFQIQTFEHDLIPGRRKTLMRFEGCHKDYGCTIILRGGDLSTLRKVKVVTDFMALVVCHLKYEIILYNDEHNILPPQQHMPSEYQELLDTLLETEEHTRETLPTPTLASSSKSIGPEDDEKQAERLEALRQTQDIARSLKPYLTTALSASAAIRFPPPAPLARMAELDRLLRTLRDHRDEEEAAQILEEETKVPDIAKPSPPDINPPNTAVPIIVEPNSSGKVEATQSVPMAVTNTAISSKEATRDPYRVLRKPEEIARESALSHVAHEHSEQLKVWQAYTRRHIPSLRPEDFQGIVYLYSLSCEGAEKPCVEPTLQAINFYQPDDLTVGQYLEGLALDAAKRCTKQSCERLLLFHFRLLVHGDRRLQIAMDQFPCPSPGHEDRIITWSYCRQCATPSPTTILREETWTLSWGSYLEHCFYPPECSAGFTCPHDAYRDQIRYFAHRNLAIRIHNENIDIYEPVRPSIKLQVKAETKVILKNQEYESALQKNAAFFDSILFRLRSFDYELVQPEKVTLLRTALEAMLARAVSDREEMVNLLNRTYKLTPITDVLALNSVLQTLQDRVIQWDSDFVDVEKVFMPSEKDLRRMTATHLKRLFANQDVLNSLDRNTAGFTVSEVDEKEPKTGLADTGVTEDSEPPTPTASDPGPADALLDSDSLTPAGTSDGGVTPLAGLVNPVSNAMSPPQSPAGTNDSDSTIGAKKVGSPLRLIQKSADAVESSGMDSDALGFPFPSRLPRRTKPTPSVADMVKRFQQEDTIGLFDLAEQIGMERPRSSSSIRRSGHRAQTADNSDSDVLPGSRPPRARPPMRRGRTEQPPTRHREASKLGLLSDGDRSYAANASRIPSSSVRRFGVGHGDSYRPGARSRPTTAPSSPPRSRQASPDPLRPELPRKNSNGPPDGKPRISGKGKMPRSSDLYSGRMAGGIIRTAVGRTLASSNRVTSIARHFDRLSIEAERQRQKRITNTRGKRARPVGVTKAKVQVFSNVRDAFRDETDSDSSEADNEQDDQGSDDSAESAGEGHPKSRRKLSSPVKPILAKLTPSEPVTVDDSTLSVPVKASSSSELSPSASFTSGGIPISASASSINAPSIFSDTRSEMSFTDRLQIELPTFETSAPLPSVPATPHLSADTSEETKKEVAHLSQMSESEMSSGGGERTSIIKTLTGLWAFRAGDYTPLEYPLSAAEHLFADSRVIIRENEPTSIIAFTLNNKSYKENMRSHRFNGRSEKVESFMPEDGSGADRASSWDIVSLDEAMETDDPSKREGGTHLKYDFENGGSTIFCRIFFAERFAALRAACECEDSFVESLSRCVQFDASGGKSGSAFLKTKDDRFIAKEISRLEMDALTKFAPAYFEYTRNAIQGQRPTVLAKIYGFFKIGYKNATTGRTMRMNVLVMENLFYERRFSKIYDLKGSMRNRLIQPTGRINEVLLDENLMELAYKHPLYLREHSKKVLRSALFNDTLFLSNLNVMDYSLVVGVDSEKQELVVGIVDYIRTFTWDKKLESWVKDSTFLGGPGKGEPTIVTPKQYKTRFRSAMEKFYFPSVPDRWSKIGVEEQATEEESAQSTNI